MKLPKNRQIAVLLVYAYKNHFRFLHFLPVLDPCQAELQKFGEHIVAGDDQRLYEAIQDFWAKNRENGDDMGGVRVKKE